MPVICAQKNISLKLRLEYRPSDAAEPFNLSDSSALEQVSQTHFSPAKPKSDMMQHINSGPGTSSASLANRWGPNACVRHDVDSEGDLASLSSIGSEDSSYSVYDKCEADAAPEHQPLEWQVQTVPYLRLY